MRNTLLFTYSTNILVPVVRLLTVDMKDCLIPKIRKMCDPILVPGGYFKNFWVGMCRWDPETLNLYQS